MKLKVTKVKSTIGYNKKQGLVMQSLGLHKMNQVKIHDDNPVIRGMINKVSHLVKVEEID
ncbi:MAG: 50S ribosomal protein L30 [Candidatus Cloacimonadales bacterium]|jgi:large subunit ribosomal protein L30|nr:50S ribosomal protein L30 [Candidatus Cloacimonadota bacterium]MDD3501281.1 50S ribosomal protein L30 [Candidatus Cloacimonadota bacterium]MDX9977377.1 50S ribosomal protein L30 [Candidatus Cloacimonadales bacterium]